MKIQHIQYTHPQFHTIVKGMYIQPTGIMKAVIQICPDCYDYVGRYTGVLETLAMEGFAVFGFDYIGTSKDLIEDQNQYPQAMVEELHLGFLHVCHNLQASITKAIHETGYALPHILLGIGFGALLARLYTVRFDDTSALILSGDEGFVKQATFYRKLQKLSKHTDTEEVAQQMHQFMIQTWNMYFQSSDTSQYAWRTSLPKQQLKLEEDPLVNRPYTVKQLKDMFSLYRLNEMKTWIDACPDELPLFMMSGYMDPRNRFTRDLDPFLKALGRSSMKNVFYRYYADSRHDVLFDRNQGEAIQDIKHFIKAILHQREN